MSYALRDRPDGQVELVFLRPTLIGTFPDRDLARRVCVLLENDEDLPEDILPDDGPSDLELEDAAGEQTLRALVTTSPDPVQPTLSAGPPSTKASPKAPKKRQASTLPVPAEKRLPPVPIKTVEPAHLTEDQKDAAFARLGAGEKLAAVAADFDITMNQLRGMWANHKRQLQKYMAEGGQQPCQLCGRQFTPSPSHPDTCSRCSHG